MNSPVICTICQNECTNECTVVETACSHRFHKRCLLKCLNSKEICPECHVPCSKTNFRIVQIDFSTNNDNNENPTTSQNILVTENLILNQGGQSNPINLDDNIQALLQQPTPPARPITPQFSRDLSRQANNYNKLPSADIHDLENRITARLEQTVQSSIAALLSQINLQGRTERSPIVENRNSNIHWPRDMPFVNTEDRSSISSVNNASKVAHLISNWNIRFDGTNLPVETFIYRVECQVMDTLGNNFELLCQNAQALFTGPAKEWYWRYRSQVLKVNWSSLCHNLKTDFGDFRSDSDIKEEIRDRKQNFKEPFDHYKNEVLRLSERLKVPMSERELVEVLVRGLQPKLKQQLLFVEVRSVAQLREYCLKSERLSIELTRNNTQVNRFNTNKRVNEIVIQEDNRKEEEVSEDLFVEAIRKHPNKLECWNCKKIGHRYQDCIEKDRKIFCYGCGMPNTYKPNCPKCSPGNLKATEDSSKNLL